MDGFSKQAKYFPTQLQQFQFVDKYARFNTDKGRRETWDESVARAVAYLVELSDNKLSNKDYTDILNAMLNMEAFGSMRLFAMAGEAARRCNSVLYNCAYVAIDSIRVFSEILYLSMSGTGVGFSVELANVNKLPEIPKMNSHIGKPWAVEDSQQGWAEAFHIGLSSWFSGNDIEFDYSQIRPIGSILKTKGGRASGPEPLKKLLDYSRETIINARGRKLRPIEVHDIVCMIGDCAVSGGSRRSAMLSLFDRNDTEMLHAKDYGWWKTHPQRSNANNSAVVNTHLSREEISKIMYTMHNGGGGEPAFFMRKNALKTSPRRKEYQNFGTNPCFSEDTYIITEEGSYQIKDLVGKVVKIWDGNNWVSIDNFRITATNQEMLDIEMYKGHKLRVTPYHKLVLESGDVIEARSLKVGDRLMTSNAPESLGIKGYGAYLKGFLLGDGWYENTNYERVRLYLFENKFNCAKRLIESANEILPINGFCGQTEVVFTDPKSRKNRNEKYMSMLGLSSRVHDLVDYLADKTRIPKEVFSWDLQSKKEFIAGLFDADGHLTKSSQTYGIKSINKDMLLDLQTLLSTIGIESIVRQISKGSYRDFPNGTYWQKPAYKLKLGKGESSQLFSAVDFSRLVNKPQGLKKASGVKGRHNEVVSISNGGIDETVYCCTVDTTHQLALSCGIMSSQCGEINLRSKEFCNLSQAIVRYNDTAITLKEKVRIATIISTIQSMASNFKYLSDEWKKNTEEERLCGVDITGQMDNPSLITPELLDELREYAIQINKEYAEKLGIEQSVAITCNKPSGNSSVLFSCAPGIHSQWSKYYIRRVRINANSPMRYALEFSGFKLHPENGQQYETAVTLVAEFPMKAPDGAVTNGDRGAIEQCEWWKMNKLHWTEHNPSTTISYTADELESIIDWIYENQDVIGGMSFLEKDNHYYPLAPYSKIDKETYERMVQELPEIDFDLLMMLEKEDQTTVAGEIACSAGQCLI